MLILLLIPPTFIAIINWHWQPESLNTGSKYLFWITETAGTPWGFLTCIFFSLVFIVLLKIRTKSAMLKLICLLILAMVVGQSIKSVVKTFTAEPRPFVLWMQAQYHLDDGYFCSSPGSERKEIIKEYVSHSPQIPRWLSHYWRSQTGYTFPSGHTMFAATWAFLALVLLNFRRHYIFVSLSVAWTMLVEISRVSLGMHRPIDLVAGVGIAWLITLFAYYLAKRWRIIKA